MASSSIERTHLIVREDNIVTRYVIRAVYIMLIACTLMICKM